MSEEPEPDTLRAEHVREIAFQTGVTEEQIRMLIELVGTDRASILREVGFLRNRH
jgi:hypothetical protein